MARPIQIDSLILEQLASGEKGLLRLVVAARKALRFEKGDLSEIVKAALHKLVVSEVVVDVDGIYSLSPSPLAKADRSAHR